MSSLITQKNSIRRAIRISARSSPRSPTRDRVSYAPLSSYRSSHTKPSRYESRSFAVLAGSLSIPDEFRARAGKYHNNLATGSLGRSSRRVYSPARLFITRHIRDVSALGVAPRSAEATFETAFFQSNAHSASFSEYHSTFGATRNIEGRSKDPRSRRDGLRG